MKLITFIGAIIVPLFVLASTSAFAAPGDLDTTFGTDGKVTTGFGSGDDNGVSVAVQADGKIVVAGYSYNGSKPDFALARYATTGGLDTTFNGTGKVTTAFDSGSNGVSVAVQADGKIVVAGQLWNGFNGYDFALARYTSTGALDTTFNGTGKVTTAFGSGDDCGRGVAVQADGKIVVAGYSYNGSNYDFALARYTSTGALDTTFNGTGKVTTDFGGGDYGCSVAVQADGKIVVAGHSSNGSNGGFALARYTGTGALDTTFNGTGKVTTAFDSGSNGMSVAVQADGKIVVAGYSYNGSNYDFALARYNADGSLDTTFNGTGEVTTAFGSSHDYGESVAVQADGKIVVAGYSYNGSNYDFALARYATTGGLDTTFNGTGKVTTGIFSGDDYGNSVAVQADGKIVVAGYSYNGSNYDFALARYLGGPPDIAVEQPSGTDLVDGTSNVAFGAALTGTTASRIFTVKNKGVEHLTGLGITIDGANAAEFTVTGSPAAPVAGPTGSTTFTVRFAPTVAGARTAALHIASNDPDENPFDIGLTGRGLAPEADDDGDGLLNQREVSLAGCGFDPLVADSALFALLRDNGLYRASDMQTLALGNPLLQKDAVSGHFHLSIMVEKSPDLQTWTTLVGFTPTYDEETGKIDIEFTPAPLNAEFFRVLGAKP